MQTLNHLPTLLQHLLVTEANQLASESGLIRRQREWTGAAFATSCVLGWMSQPNATLQQLQQAALEAGCRVSIKSVATRLSSPQATHFFQRLLERALLLSHFAPTSSQPLDLPFKHIVLRDSTQVSLPLSLAVAWPGGGNQNQKRAGMKIQANYEWVQGRLQLDCSPAITSDRKLPLPALEVGSLVIQDSGFLSVANCLHAEAQGVYWLARVSAQMGVVDAQGHHWALSSYLETCTDQQLDQPMELTHKRHPIRLLAIRLPPLVAQEREAKLRAECQRRKGKPPGAEALALCQWCVLATNVPASMLSLEQALVLYRARWQVELLFKLWKQEGMLDEWRTQNVQRIQTELYAKLLMVLLQHWILVETCWQFHDRSLVKAVHCLRRHLTELTKHMRSMGALERILSDISQGMTLCRVAKRRKRLAFFQLLDAFFLLA